MKIITSVALVIFLAACGGGGGGDGGSTSSSDGSGGVSSAGYALVTPTKLTATPQTGSPSFVVDVSDYGTGTVAFPRTTEAGSYGYPSAIYNAATSTSFQLYPVVHLTNEVRNAWANGWTGAGVTISVIDDFLNSAELL